MKYYLYIIQSKVNQSHYIGYSVNPWRRVEYHNEQNKGFTRRNRPWVIVYTEAFDTKSQAMKAERIVKKWKSKRMIQQLIQREINITDYLKD